ncbi:MAG: tRNA glutamyl-Q(34) synthetase GluQRS [Pseudomonadota bacterium]
MITRFAPSPTGPLHLGHALSAITAHDAARAAGGTFLLRIEDLDQSRCRPEYEAGIFDDLAWLGLTWDGPVWRQTDRTAAYANTLRQLDQLGLIFPCQCRRADILAAYTGDPPFGPDGILYPGTCRHRSMADRAPQDAVRLDMAKAVQQIDPVTFREGDQIVACDDLTSKVGDVVLARRDSGAAAYHLACIVDDAAQGVTHVIRGLDLFEATQIHVVLQQLLGLPTPNYQHHRLITDENGKRLAKRHDSKAIAKFRQEGLSPANIRQMIGL